MTFETWDEIRTAYHVARLGNVSGAAEALGVHHATVIRHVDALEARLGAKLFQRHARGYTATEAGQDLLRVAQATDDQFAQLSGRIKGQGHDVSGELVVTSLPGVSRLITPCLVRFQAANPGLSVRFLTDQRLFRLEYGEAHVAIRAGRVPDQPDNVVRALGRLRFALYASKGYLAVNGMPLTEADLGHHVFVGPAIEMPQLSFYEWMRRVAPQRNIVFRTTDLAVARDAVVAGAGMGFVAVIEAGDYPDLVQVLPPRDDWAGGLWVVTHVDLHRTAKVQAFLAHLRHDARDWGLL